MKKIIFAALAVLMMLGFAGCSGDLHDVSDVYLVGYKLINVPDSYEGKTIYAHGETCGDKVAQPGNVWGDTTPHKAVVAGGKATIEFTAANIWVPGKDVTIQVIAKHWDDKIVEGAASSTFTSLEAGANYFIQVDCTEKKVTFVK